MRNNLLKAQIMDALSKFYSSVQLSKDALDQLNKWGERGEQYILHFEEDKNKAMNTTFQCIMKAIEYGIFNGLAPKDMIQNIYTIIDKRIGILRNCSNLSVDNSIGLCYYGPIKIWAIAVTGL